MVEIAEIAFLYGSKRFKKEVAEFFLDNEKKRKQITNSRDWKELIKNHPTLYNEMFAAYNSDIKEDLIVK